MKDLRIEFTAIAAVISITLIALFFVVSEVAHYNILTEMTNLGASSAEIEALNAVQAKTRVMTGVMGLLTGAAIFILFYWMSRISKRLTDLTKRNQVHERLAHTGTLASGLVHELKNPLNAVKMNLQLLEEDMEEREGDDSPSMRRLRRVLTEVDRLDRVLKDFLSYARPKKLEKSADDVARILDETISLIAAQAEAQGVRILRDLPDGLPMIAVDADALKQAFLNLALNAVSAMEGVKDPTLMVRAAKLAGGVKVEITDTGKGIPAEKQKRIFDLFFTTKEEGTGLGLAVVKRVIEEHDGTITVSSEEGRGTSFIITLPGD